MTGRVVDVITNIRNVFFFANQTLEDRELERYTRGRSVSAAELRTDPSCACGACSTCWTSACGSCSSAARSMHGCTA